MPYKAKLQRDKVTSLTENGELVGVYFMQDGTERLLGEVSPELADKIINLWNNNN